MSGPLSTIITGKWVNVIYLSGCSFLFLSYWLLTYKLSHAYRDTSKSLAAWFQKMFSESRKPGTLWVSVEESLSNDWLLPIFWGAEELSLRKWVEDLLCSIAWCWPRVSRRAGARREGEHMMYHCLDVWRRWSMSVEWHFSQEKLWSLLENIKDL